MLFVRRSRIFSEWECSAMSASSMVFVYQVSLVEGCKLCLVGRWPPLRSLAVDVTRERDHKVR